MQNNKIPRTKDELFSELQTQIRFLQNECEQYDSGYLEYSKRIALTLRILLHNTRCSNSLLHQIESTFVYNCPDFIDISTTHGSLSGEGNTDFVRSSMCAYELNHDIDSPPVLTPKPIIFRANERYPRRAFKTWWEDLHITLINKNLFLSRKDVVTLVADQDGGAHVDSEVDERLLLLSRNYANPLKIQIPIEGTMKIYIAQTEQILAANIRSIAEETLYVFDSILTYCESKL